MTITYIEDDLLSATHGIIIHGCNCVGAFGSGIAGQIRRKWPNVYQEFLKFPKGKCSLGKIQPVPINDNLFVINCFTQLKYGYDYQKYASIEAITRCLMKVFTFANNHNLHIHSPRIGCGLGGLSWDNDVSIIFEYLNEKYNNINITVYDYKP